MGTVLGMVGYPGIAMVLLGLVEFLVTVPVLKGKVGMAVVGVLLLALRGAGLIVLIVGSSRLARPRSVWARWMYDDPTSAMAWARFPDLPVDQGRGNAVGGPDGAPGQVAGPDTRSASVPYPPTVPVPDPWAPPPPARPTGPRPRELTVAFWLLVAGSVLSLVGGGVCGLFVGIVGPHLMLMRAGRRRSRNVVAALTAISATAGVVLAVVLLVVSQVPPSAEFGVTVGGAALVAALTAVALRLLYRDPVDTHLRAAVG